ncbi:MAG: Galactoside O-acetyltransferase [Betaproteobacteria bacterium ADurb.Bin341]|nr:MAG: Galactoside O-acetyltransferase [Betaproteobacteria bacterium ADurb.Bin341]
MPVYALGDLCPQLGNKVWVAPNATVIGDVQLADNVSVWWNAVLRADSACISIGPGSNIQDNSVLHVDYDTPLTIGRAVTIAHMVMLHGCTIGDNSLIGVGAIILNRSVIGKNCIVASNSLIPEGKEYPEGVMIMGSPGKVMRDLTEKELAYLAYPSSHYVENAERYRKELRQIG